MAGPVVRSEQGLPVSQEEQAAAVAAVRDLLGPDHRVVSVEKSVCVREEEVGLLLLLSCLSNLSHLSPRCCW